MRRRKALCCRGAPPSLTVHFTSSNAPPTLLLRPSRSRRRSAGRYPVFRPRTHTPPLSSETRSRAIASSLPPTRTLTRRDECAPFSRSGEKLPTGAGPSAPIRREPIGRICTPIRKARTSLTRAAASRCSRPSSSRRPIFGQRRLPIFRRRPRTNSSTTTGLSTRLTISARRLPRRRSNTATWKTTIGATCLRPRRLPRSALLPVLGVALPIAIGAVAFQHGFHHDGIAPRGQPRLRQAAFAPPPLPANIRPVAPPAPVAAAGPVANAAVVKPLRPMAGGAASPAGRARLQANRRRRSASDRANCCGARRPGAGAQAASGPAGRRQPGRWRPRRRRARSRRQAGSPCRPRRRPPWLSQTAQRLRLRPRPRRSLPAASHCLQSLRQTQPVRLRRPQRQSWSSLRRPRPLLARQPSPAASRCLHPLRQMRLSQPRRRWRQWWPSLRRLRPLLQRQTSQAASPCLQSRRQTQPSRPLRRWRQWWPSPRRRRPLSLPQPFPLPASPCQLRRMRRRNRRRQRPQAFQRRSRPSSRNRQLQRR